MLLETALITRFGSPLAINNTPFSVFKTKSSTFNIQVCVYLLERRPEVLENEGPDFLVGRSKRLHNSI